MGASITHMVTVPIRASHVRSRSAAGGNGRPADFYGAYLFGWITR